MSPATPLALTTEAPKHIEDLLASESEAVLKLARRLLGDPEEARDLAQDALERACRALGRFRGESSLRTWVLRITLHEGIKRIRRRRIKEKVLGWLRASAAPGGWARAMADDPEQNLALREEAFLFAQALASLPTRQRVVLTLRFLEGLSVTEIADLLGVGAGTVKTHLVRGLGRVRARREKGSL
jgi:RNA polymerase sigma-70 factor (ECF subfamily)